MGTTEIKYYFADVAEEFTLSGKKESIYFTITQISPKAWRCLYNDSNYHSKYKSDGFTVSIIENSSQEVISENGSAQETMCRNIWKTLSAKLKNKNHDATFKINPSK